MLDALSGYLRDGGRLCLITGGSLERVTGGVTDGIDPALRCRLLVSPASGAELWGFNESGALDAAPLVSGTLGRLTADIRQRWHGVLAQLVEEFGLRLHAARPPDRFQAEVGREQRDVMFSDRGPQMSLEFVNGDSGGALRLAVLERARELLPLATVPITPRLTGVFALNMTLSGISKASAVVALLNGPEILARIGLKPADLAPDAIEVWGDDFSSASGGIDLDMCQAAPAAARTIDFRDEDPAELPADRNIVLWDGQHRLQQGLLEFLQTRGSG
jgi:hypothetical protein